ncbi:MAG TPA: glycosyltransferase family A protein [Gammaproteobacteria bacterium]
MPGVTVLVPTCNRHAALAVMLTSLHAQDFSDFDVVIADQSDVDSSGQRSPLTAVIRVLEARGIKVSMKRNIPRRGMAQQRQFLLDQSTSEYSLFLDDDLVLEPYVIRLLENVLRREDCGFAGSAPIGLSYSEDWRPDEQAVEFWRGPVQPERVTPMDPAWQRHKLHNAANLWHVQREQHAIAADPLRYKVAWVGGCVMYDTMKLRHAGGFDFWKQLPASHCGEDVLAQLRVAEKFGGCGVMPSGVYHQELETTVPERRVNAPHFLNP